MKLSQIVLLTVAVLLLAEMTPSTAQAQWTPGCGQVNYWLGNMGNVGQFYGGNFSRPYASGRIPTPPYFAIHPPVYYSYPVPRSYGYSPFAYPGIVATPEVLNASPPKPAEVINPHVKPSAKKAAEQTQDRTAQNHQMILNPYVGQPNLRAGIELARLRQDNR